ncbi:ATP-binding domain-containing protein [bacterium]|nr:ATP-binding domain-containing protein [bacterium]
MQTFSKYLNPIYKDIDSIDDFSSVKPADALEKEEYPHLEKITHITKHRLDFLIDQLHKLEADLEHQAEIVAMEGSLEERKESKSVYNKILEKISLQVDKIDLELSTFDSPYFGKISFLSYDSRTGKPLQLYIGKNAVIDNDTHLPLVTDWRSPIANLYYENSGPTEDVSFIAPVGERRGDLLQKRQFQISRARIKGIYDAKSGNSAADEFLLSQLTERIGKKLQDIVATIQVQQNEIIRGKINQPILMQGVAGSGKTTILLHRLAYLFYTYKESISSENSLIIAPNQMFIDYVSDVLPNLGISKVNTETYLFWAKKLLGWDNYYTLSNQDENLEFKLYKGSVEFIDVLDKYISHFEEEVLSNIPSKEKDVIRRRYYELVEEFPDLDMAQRLELATGYAYAQKQFRKMTTDPFKRELVDSNTEQTAVLRYFRSKCNIYNLYRNMYKFGFVSSDLSKYSLKGLTVNGRLHNYRVEDLAPMAYLHMRINGIKDSMYDYVMVDEAQDLSYVQLATLIKVARGGNITIAGDLAQSIIPPFYIKEWGSVEEIIKKYAHKTVEFHELLKCYRTTIEIMDFAKKILKNNFVSSYKSPEAVLRHGDDVNILELNGNDIEPVIMKIKKYLNHGAVSCAVLCKDRDRADAMFDILKKHEKSIKANISSYTEKNYQSGVLVLPIESAKGLEFDAVILMDVNSDVYSKDLLDIKLLYVGITRALHNLTVIKNKGDKLLNELLCKAH